MDKSSEYRLEQYASRYSQGIKSMSSFNHTTNNYFHILYIYTILNQVYIICIGPIYSQLVSSVFQDL
ncbi:unnamed protein product [Heterobilharzia americana]|nr:unnamed protein product [Heterobilharzia americana]